MRVLLHLEGCVRLIRILRGLFSDKYMRLVEIYFFSHFIRMRISGAFFFLDFLSTIQIVWVNTKILLLYLIRVRYLIHWDI